MHLPARTVTVTGSPSPRGNQSSSSCPLMAWFLGISLPSVLPLAELQLSPCPQQRKSLSGRDRHPATSIQLVGDGQGHKPTFLGPGLRPLHQKCLPTSVRGQPSSGLPAPPSQRDAGRAVCSTMGACPPTLHQALRWVPEEGQCSSMA